MRSFSFVACLVFLAACDSDGERLVQTEVLWMDWPAEVVAQTPFRTRLVVPWGCRAEGFHPGGSIDLSAVTFRPYHFVGNHPCPLTDRTLELDVWGALDTAGMVPGLTAALVRTYEMRAAASPEFGLSSDSPPIRTFGDITVQVSDGELTSRRNAAGRAWAVRTMDGCLRLQPTGVSASPGLLPIENPDDTTQYRTRFVRGYIYDAPAPVCGETRVFHLVSAN